MRTYPSLRRALVVAVCALALTAGSAVPASAAGFKYGVAAADVTSTSALLWTRSDKAGTIRLEITTNPTSSDKRTIGNLQAKSANDNTVSVISAATNLVVATVPVGTTPRAIGRFIGPVTSPIPTPTLSEWTLAATALLLLAVGLLRRRAR